MKIVSSKQMSEIESLAYRNGASESDFMEEAGSGVALVVHDYVERNNLDHTAILLCGKGNNAGDAYVAGTHLLNLEYDVFAIQLTPMSECSNLCKQNFARFINEGGRVTETIPELPQNGIIIDGLFGTGFHGIATGNYETIINMANGSGLPIIAVDIPSGLDGETGETQGPAIIANETAFLGLPKTGFFLREGWDHVGKLRYVDFGLPGEYIEKMASDFIMTSPDLLLPLMPPIKRTRHKYQAGMVIGITGSPSMPGAAVLSSMAAIKSGAGVVRICFPDGMQSELAMTPPEIIRMTYTANDLSAILEQLQRATAVYIGPGIGLTEESKKLVRTLLPQIQKPCVIDADALTIISKEEIPLPKQTVLTPHLGEMMRLLNIKETPTIDMKFLNLCRTYAIKKNVTLVLKGAPTFIFHADHPIIVNPTGDPGMATAGSGDVLTGLIAGLIAQGVAPEAAAVLGVFLHGLAGEHAAVELTPYGVVASDIVFHFPEAFRFYML